MEWVQGFSAQYWYEDRQWNGNSSTGISTGNGMGIVVLVWNYKYVHSKMQVLQEFFYKGRKLTRWDPLNKKTQDPQTRL